MQFSEDINSNIKYKKMLKNEKIKEDSDHEAIFDVMGMYNGDAIYEKTSIIHA